ncbi:Pimeloyl-ACP methyl ester carboxylesterase [Andreprevotia lacus DSM 23236]|uniref:Pimeloyl-ACP methyl ester carboxylesterase n=1 Tax=Andreprevotia lacus DSM 23236 TaxID=1121001 RepID=A0A1W1XHB8_9NEIS|nr:alpha/beta hydrolase [Andreprevotia lacus]SMC23385.1 Pimeloyl-ACP methyl ester carboxylesterase [Andreprevotia lacus DSM 23236]
MTQTRMPKLLRPLMLLSALALMAGCSTSMGGPGSRHGGKNQPAYTLQGVGTPTVVLQAGLLDGKEAWDDVLQELAANNQVFAFDRPGHNRVPASKTPRDPCTIASEQRQLLRNAGIKPPYILVGHSIGGLYQYAYAAMYPEDVAGMVLLDPTHPRHWETIQRDAPDAVGMIRLARLAAFSSTDKAEFDAQAQCLERFNGIKMPAVPIRLLVSGRFKAEERGQYENALKRLRQDWLRLLGIKNMKTIADSGHYIQKDAPEEVVAAVRQVSAEARQR